MRAIDAVIRELISKVKNLAETSSLEYTLGKTNAENTDNEIEKIKENYRADMNEGKLFAYDEMLCILEQYLSLDVKPITYCKDCKHYNGKRHKCQITYNCHGQKFFRGEYDYCSKGEKWGNNEKGD